ncbi:hypothetical protein H310_03215 [Aphanomyces invadans]|uniref:EGF-like domain-containing protein n=1 Tax=Aphanomyces invadans TaxID=157072 RepID=A0A024UHX9_9STRA|nr:hypothetical protein H310_03215 [Aphanomyces invadans]ETW05452.1 hypothetical protein H310_03215 [Aphanomyces invadans]|eukprot:XP_008865229.1 hypothetical protein H310_03215 [Aphanomyces invadans]
MKRSAVLVIVLGHGGVTSAAKGPHYDAKSGIPAWVDIDTPKQYYKATSSRGETWNLVMSDEFNRPGRNFTAGVDPMWTAIEMADGVNAALEYYSVNMTETVMEPDGRGVFRIVTKHDDISFRVYNPYKTPPGFQQSRMYYRSGMLQSWNKFCMQGGLIEVMCQQPGVTGANNPDASNPQARVTGGIYYPTWPGVWLLGNLGRALFLSSTTRMWPWSYDVCDKNLEKDQRISACDSNPGFGLNPNQGRGAPEIDILEGGGAAISSSVQIAPGMPDEYRPVFPADDNNAYCIYSNECKTIGANTPDVPSSMTVTRGHRSWYQGLRYAAHVCATSAKDVQSAVAINASLTSGITANACSLSTCPASFDVNGDRGPVDGKAGTGLYWGINTKGQCFPVMNGYNGAYLCDPYTTNAKCTAPLHSDGNSNGNNISPFSYQMDAISANWPVEFAAYSGYLKYQLEWVMGRQGYVRWMIDGVPLFEIPAESLENPPQNAAMSNPKKLMIEEPLYLIFNTALSTSWGTQPPNPGKPCRGDGRDDKVNRVCDAFPLYLKIDYIRVWQNTSTMSVGCDPASHPTRLWIDGHKSDYEDVDNPNIDVDGNAFCTDNADCTLAGSIVTGSCSDTKRCVCSAPAVWGGPRCTSNRGSVSGSASTGSMGPPLVAVVIISVLATAGAALIVYIRGRGKRLQLQFRGNLYANAEPMTMPQEMNLRGTVISRQGSMEEMAASKSGGAASRTDTIRSRRVV